LQRRRRHAVFSDPRTTPYLRKASLAYWEQDGWYLHVGAPGTPTGGKKARSARLRYLT
jgi:hypothetical protein